MKKTTKALIYDLQNDLNLILKCKEDKTVLYNLNQMIKNINYTKKLINLNK